MNELYVDLYYWLKCQLVLSAAYQNQCVVNFTEQQLVASLAWPANDVRCTYLISAAACGSVVQANQCFVLILEGFLNLKNKMLEK